MRGCLPWRHHWLAIAADPLVTITVVRELCLRCSRQRTRDVDGTWTLAVLRGEVGL